MEDTVDADIRNWEEDLRLMLLMFAFSFIILSLISIISITTCILMCCNDDNEGVPGPGNTSHTSADQDTTTCLV